MKIRISLPHSSKIRRFSTRFSSSRWLKGPWLTRELVPDQRPIFAITFQELAKQTAHRFDRSSRPVVATEGSGGPMKYSGLELLKDFRTIATYNWAGNPADPVMVIPGAPRLFRSEWTGGELRRDTGDRVICRNQYMCPDNPVEPMFVAVRKCAELQRLLSPHPDLFDVATDRTNLDKFALFCTRQGSLPNSPYVTASGLGIRIDVERVGERMVIFVPRERTSTMPSLANTPTYGRDFRLKITKEPPMFSNSPSNPLHRTLSSLPSCTFDLTGRQHHIVSYRFGNLDLLVRLKIYCVDDELSSSQSNAAAEETALNSIPGSKLRYILAGRLQHFHKVQLLIRRSYGTLPLHLWLQMYLSQVDSLAVGWSNVNADGTCHVIPRVYSREECKSMTKMSASSRYVRYDDEQCLELMHELLNRLVAFVRSQPREKKFAILWQRHPHGQLLVYEKVSYCSDALPEYLMREI